MKRPPLTEERKDERLYKDKRIPRPNTCLYDLELGLVECEHGMMWLKANESHSTTAVKNTFCTKCIEGKCHHDKY